MPTKKKSTKKVKAQGMVKVRVYPVIDRAVEDGIVYGWNRAHKYDSNPPRIVIQEQIAQAVMSNLCEALDFDCDLD